MAPPRRSFPNRKADAMDHWLDSQGLYRKHTARDGSCLFRAVAEQVFDTQCFHLEVRRQCVQYMLERQNYYKGLIYGSFEEYIEGMRNPLQCGGKVELEAISFLYKRGVVVHHNIGSLPLISNECGFEKSLNLCFSHSKHYDSVFTKVQVDNAAFCQSLVYEVLYKNVFNLTEVNFAVDEMLHSKSYNNQRSKADTLYKMGLETIPEEDSSDQCTVTNMKTLILGGVTPFPYKVAKCLDPDIYRNIEFDIWSDQRRELRHGMLLASGELQVGSKCLLIDDSNASDPATYHAHIQSMTPNKGPVEIFVEELGEKRTVLHRQLQPIPVGSAAVASATLVRTYNMTGRVQLSAAELGSKWRKGKINPGRKYKDTAVALQSKVGMNDMNMQSFKNKDISPANQMTMFMSISPPADGGEVNMGGGGEPSAAPTSSRSPPPHFVTFVPYPGNTSPTSSCGYYTASPSPPPPLPPIEPAAALQIKDVNDNVINVSCGRSSLSDGSDIPLEDMPTVRFFYNLGHDYFQLLHSQNAALSVQGDKNHSLDVGTNEGLITGLTPPDRPGNEMMVVSHGPDAFYSCNCPGEVSPCDPTSPFYAVARMAPYPQAALYGQVVPYYPLEGGATVPGYYQPCDYAVMPHTMERGEEAAGEGHAEYRQADTAASMYPFGLHFNSSPASFVFHHQSASSGMFTPPPLNGVPYSPPPNGVFSIPHPSAVFAMPSPQSPQTLLPSWLPNQANNK